MIRFCMRKIQIYSGSVSRCNIILTSLRYSQNRSKLAIDYPRAFHPPQSSTAYFQNLLHPIRVTLKDSNNEWMIRGHSCTAARFIYCAPLEGRTLDAVAFQSPGNWGFSWTSTSEARFLQVLRA